MAKSRIKNLEHVFAKSLSDLIRGLRSNKVEESKFISEAIEECRQEMRQENVYIKANAIMKLVYLQMLGYDMSWASFNVVEVMSSTRYTLKRIGYLAAGQSFNSQTEVLMLTTNLIKKDLNSNNPLEVGLALTGLSEFMTPDLAADLANDISNMMTSSRPYLRRKATLLMYQVFLQYPDSLRPLFPRLKDRLADEDPSVQAAAVTVISELGRRNPSNYLSLAPILYEMLQNSSNNWLLIKVVKLLTAMTQVEPRLSKKIAEPLTMLVNTTPAKSLAYECIIAIITSANMIQYGSAVQAALSKLQEFVEDQDQNLRYLGLLAMNKILALHPKALSNHREMVVLCLDYEDESIRLRALDLLVGMATPKNLQATVKKLVLHLKAAPNGGQAYRDKVARKIVEMCSLESYKNVTNFEVYLAVLVELSHVEGTMLGTLLASQMLDVTVRVSGLRAFSAELMADNVLRDDNLLLSIPGSACEVLGSAAFIVGEYCSKLPDLDVVVRSLLRIGCTILPPSIQSMHVLAAMKIYAAICDRLSSRQGLAKMPEAKEDGIVPENDDEEEDDEEEIIEGSLLDIDDEECWTLLYALEGLILEHLPAFTSQGDLEVQERAMFLQQLVSMNQELRANVPQGDKERLCIILGSVSSLFVGELRPVNAKAQRKVVVPEGLDLDAWIGEPFESPHRMGAMSIDEDDGWDINELIGGKKKGKKKKGDKKRTKEERAERRRRRAAEKAASPYFLDTGDNTQAGAFPDIDSVPVETLDLDMDLQVNDAQQEEGKRRKKKKEPTLLFEQVAAKSKNKKAKARKAKRVLVDDDMPEGAQLSDDEEKKLAGAQKDSRFAALDQNLDEPLNTAAQRLPTRAHRSDTLPMPEPINSLASVVPQAEADDVAANYLGGKPKKSKKKATAGTTGDPAEKKKKKKEKEREKAGVGTDKSKRKKKTKAGALQRKTSLSSNLRREIHAQQQIRADDHGIEGAFDWTLCFDVQTVPEEGVDTSANQFRGPLDLSVRVRLSENSPIIVKQMRVFLDQPEAAGNALGFTLEGPAVEDELSQVITDNSGEIDTTITLISPGAGAEHSDQHLAAATSIPAKLQLTTVEGETRSIQFSMKISLSQLTVAKPCNPEEFISVMSAKHFLTKVERLRHATGKSYVEVRHFLQSMAGFALVEDVGTSCSMYARTFDGRHVCLLLKDVTLENGAHQPSVTIDVKATSRSLAKGLLEALKHDAGLRT
eukprot:Clim_evm5s201 gene=Clim_evmTU5s201